MSPRTRADRGRPGHKSPAKTAAGEWGCPTCGERHPSSFDTCWKCGTGRNGDPAGPDWAERVSSNHLDEPPSTLAPIGFTADGEPVFAVAGYTQDGKAVLADKILRVAPSSTRTNSWAVAAFVCAFLIAPLAIPLGHIARSEIQATGEQGDGLAITALILGYLWTGFLIVFVVAILRG
ncbi:DUF4190 domain-containing protein [Nocardia sp. NPDC046473]|uniref:DUF4190 domain-containing protein n=1 Tax=Nocardia sp. NPDC046473 TaxID=3155733 RepID=UPI0033E981C3